MKSNIRKTELSVDEAAERLGVSTRTIRSYVQEKKIQALKVGRQWFIDVACLEAFAQRSGFERPDGAEEASECAKPKEGESKEKSRDEPSSSKAVTNLACFRLCLEAFQMPLWRREEEDSLTTRVQAIRADIIESLGAGYHSYGMTKLECYSRARALCGAVLGLLYSEEARLKTYAGEVAFIERKLMPAFSALLKKIERGGRRLAAWQ